MKGKHIYCLLIALLMFPSVLYAQGTYQWVLVKTGDCAGMDYTETRNSPVPSTSLCNKHSAGKTAVCWDMATQFTEAKRVFCTYKNVHVMNCHGGHNIGYMFSCQHVNIK